MIAALALLALLSAPARAEGPAPAPSFASAAPAAPFADAAGDGEFVATQYTLATLALAERPDDDRASFLRAYAAYLAMDLPQARSGWSAFAERHAGGAAAWSNLALVDKREGRFAQEEALHRKALALQPKNATALNNLALCLGHQGRGEEALAALAEAEAGGASRPWLELHRGFLHALAKQDEAALAALSRAVEASTSLGRLSRIELLQDLRLDPALARLREDARLRAIVPAGAPLGPSALGASALPASASGAPSTSAGAPPATAGLFTGTGTPWTIGAGNGAVGLARPLTVGLGAHTDLTVNTTLGVALLAPTLSVKRTLGTSGDFAWGVSAEAGVPTPAWRFLQTGFLQPIRSDQDVPWAAVLGATALGGWRREDLVLSAGLRLRAGIPFEDGDVTAQDLVWLDPAMAPVTEGWSLQPTLRADWLASERWLLSAQGRAELAGGPELQGKAEALFAASPHVALGLGLRGALAKEAYGWTLPAVLPVQAFPTVDVQGRW